MWIRVPASPELGLQYVQPRIVPVSDPSTLILDHLWCTHFKMTSFVASYVDKTYGSSSLVLHCNSSAVGLAIPFCRSSALEARAHGQTWKNLGFLQIRHGELVYVAATEFDVQAATLMTSQSRPLLYRGGNGERK